MSGEDLFNAAGGRDIAEIHRLIGEGVDLNWTDAVPWATGNYSSYFLLYYYLLHAYPRYRSLCTLYRTIFLSTTLHITAISPYICIGRLHSSIHCITVLWQTRRRQNPCRSWSRHQYRR